MITKQKIEKVVKGVVGELIGTILRDTLIERLEDLFYENEKQVYKIGEAAKYLGVFDLSLRRWAARGLIKVYRTPGGHRRFKRADLDKLIDTPVNKKDKIRKCRECGCTNSRACHTSAGPCFWVEKNLCSVCVEKRVGSN